MKLLSFGEILWDLYPNEKYIGGAPLNFAAHLAKHGHRVYLLSCLGMDELGDEALGRLKAFGVLTPYVSRSASKPTGRCVVTLDDLGVPKYDLLSDVAYDHIPCEQIREDFDALYFGTLALRSEENLASLDTLLKGKSFQENFVDVNLRPPFYSEKTVSFALSHGTILKISQEELPSVAELLSVEPSAEAIKGEYPNLKIILITCGAEGAYCYAEGETFFCPAPKVAVVSTVGAGDSFCAAFLDRVSRGETLQSSLEYATRIAGFVVSQYDAVPDYDEKSRKFL